MATLQERRLGYHSRAGLEPGTPGFSTLRMDHHAGRSPFLGVVQPLGRPPRFGACLKLAGRAALGPDLVPGYSTKVPGPTYIWGPTYIRGETYVDRGE